MLEDALRIVDVLSSIRLMDIHGESEIHKLIARVFEQNEIAYSHEHSLGRGRRVDFMVNKTAIEIKKDAPAPAALIKQLSGYLDSEDVDEIIAVTRRRVRLPQTIHGKRVFSISLDRLWGISLP